MKKVLFIGLLVLLNACTSTTTAVDEVEIAVTPTIHKVWQLKSVAGKKYNQDILNNTEFNLEDHHKAYVYLGCNRIGLNYSINNQLSFNTPYMTRKKCNNTLENDFLVALPKIDNYSIEDDVLLLKNQDKVLMTLELKTLQPL